MHETTRSRQERLSDAAGAQQLRGRLKDESRQNERVIVVNDRMRMQLKQVGLPYKRGELNPSMWLLLYRLALHDAAKVINSHVLLWLERRELGARREQAAAMITKYTLPWLYKPGGPMMKRCAQDFSAIWGM